MSGERQLIFYVSLGPCLPGALAEILPRLACVKLQQPLVYDGQVHIKDGCSAAHVSSEPRRHLECVRQPPMLPEQSIKAAPFGPAVGAERRDPGLHLVGSR